MIPITMAIQIVIAFMLPPEEWFMSRWILMAMVAAQTLNPRENIRYELTGPTSTCPGTTIIRRNGDCPVANVKTATAGKLFTYYDVTGADLGDSPSPTAIKRIRIAFAVQVKNPDPRVGGNMMSTLSTSIELRN